MKVVSYSGPHTDTDADYATLDINVDTDVREIGMDDIHYGAIQIHGDELIGVAVAFLTFMGVKEA